MLVAVAFKVTVVFEPTANPNTSIPLEALDVNVPCNESWPL